MGTGDAREATTKAEQYLNGNRVDEAQVWALIAIAKQLDRLAGKM